MTPHDRISQFLARRAELSATEEAQVQAHLQECGECETTAASYARQTVLLRELPQVTPPAALRAGVLVGIAQSRPVPFWARLRPAMLAVPALAALVIVIAGIALLRQPHKQNHLASAPVSTVAPRVASPTTDQSSLPTATNGAIKPTVRPLPTAHHPSSGGARPTVPPNFSGLSGTQIASLPPTLVPSPYVPIVAPTSGQRPAATSRAGAASCPLPCAARHSGGHRRPTPVGLAPVRTVVPSPVAPTLGSPPTATPAPSPSGPTPGPTSPPLPTAVSTPPVAAVVTPHPTVAAPVLASSPTPVPAAPPTPGIASPTNNLATPTPSPTASPTP